MDFHLFKNMELQDVFIINEHLINCINKNKPIIFCKYGDGEYFCSSNKYIGGANCDGDTYTTKLRLSITEAFKYISDLENTFLGKWYAKETIDYWENLSQSPIKWAHYHTFIFDTNDLNNFKNNNTCDKVKIYKAIKDSKLKKIIICNQLLIKSKTLLNLDEIVLIPFNNWFDTQFEEIVEKVKKAIGDEVGKHIVLTSCGMSAKVLLAELHKSYPNGIYLDIGSGLDLLCTKKNSRTHEIKYEEIYEFFKEYDMIPDDWDDEKYDYIYSAAQNKIGLHIGPPPS